MAGGWGSLGALADSGRGVVRRGVWRGAAGAFPGARRRVVGVPHHVEPRQRATRALEKFQDANARRTGLRKLQEVHAAANFRFFRKLTLRL